MKKFFQPTKWYDIIVLTIGPIIAAIAIVVLAVIILISTVVT